MCKNNRGYTLIEILIMLIIVGLGLAVVGVNVGKSVTTIEPEAVMAQTASLILEAKGQSLLGSADVTKRTFDLQNALNLYHSGVEISTTPSSYGLVNCNVSYYPNQQAICMSGEPTPFNTNPSFTFERFSGKLTQPHAVFITNKNRKLGLMVSISGDMTIAEMINNEWYSRSDLQDLILSKQTTKK